MRCLLGFSSSDFNSSHHCGFCSFVPQKLSGFGAWCSAAKPNGDEIHSRKERIWEDEERSKELWTVFSSLEALSEGKQMEPSLCACFSLPLWLLEELVLCLYAWLCTRLYWKSESQNCVNHGAGSFNALSEVSFFPFLLFPSRSGFTFGGVTSAASSPTLPSLASSQG